MYLDMKHFMDVYRAHIEAKACMKCHNSIGVKAYNMPSAQFPDVNMKICHKCWVQSRQPLKVGFDASKWISETTTGVPTEFIEIEFIGDEDDDY